MDFPKLVRETWGWSPWSELNRFKNEVDQLFGKAGATRAEYPALDAYLGADDAVVTAELPGYSPGDIDISVRGDRLIISGSHDSEKADQEQVCLRNERFTGSFKRTIRLPFNIESEKVKAAFKNGMLKITLPRREADKPRKIKVKQAK